MMMRGPTLPFLLPICQSQYQDLVSANLPGDAEPELREAHQTVLP
jgi:hypothetical protein